MRKLKCLRGKKMVLTLVFMSIFSYANSQETKETLTLTLEQALEIALSENPTIKVAGEEIALKKEAKREAYAGLFPEISLAGSYQRAIKKQTMSMNMGDEPVTIKVGRDNTYNGGLEIGLPIFAPALYKTINLTKTDVELAIEKARASELDLINQVTKAYYQLLLTQDSYQVLQKSYEHAENNFNIVNAKYEQGVVSEYDKIRADVQMRSLVPSVVSARNGVNLAKLQLKVLMGVDPELNISIIGNLKDHEMDMFQEQLQPNHLNLINNSDLKQLDLNEKLLDRTLKIQNTNFLPTLSAGFTYSYMAMEDNFRFSRYEWYPSSMLVLNVSIPIFKASNFNKVKQTKIQKQQLAFTRINLERQLKMQMTSYQDNMDASAEQVTSNKVGIFQAEKGREIARKRYDVGRGTILELNDSEVALTQAELAYNQSIYDYLIAKADLEKLLGIEK